MALSFSVAQADLTNLVSSVRKVSSGSSNPILGNVHLAVGNGTLIATATDGESTIESSISVDRHGDAAVGLFPPLAADYVRMLPAGPVSVDIDGSNVTVTSRVGAVSFLTGDVDAFPPQQWPDESPSMLPAGDLVEAIDSVRFAASTDSARAVLTGVLFRDVDGVRHIVATDTYRLAVKSIDVPAGSTIDAVVPAEALKKLRPFLAGADTVGYTATGSVAMFTVGSVRLKTRLIPGEYPNWKGVIPSAPAGSFTVGREALDASLNRMLLLSKTKVVRFDVADNTLTLVVPGSDEVAEASESIAVAVSGSPESFSLNGSYLTAALNVLDDEIEFAVAGSIKPVRLSSPTDRTLCVIQMPLRT